MPLSHYNPEADYKDPFVLAAYMAKCKEHPRYKELREAVKQLFVLSGRNSVEGYPSISYKDSSKEADENNNYAWHRIRPLYEEFLPNFSTTDWVCAYLLEDEDDAA